MIKQQFMGRLKRGSGEKTRQSCMLDKTRLTGCLLTDHESQHCGFQVFAMDFQQ